MRRRFPGIIVRTGLVAVALGAMFFVGLAPEEVRALPQQDAKSLVNEDRMVRLLQEMVQINTEFAKGVVHNHKEMAEFLGQHLKQIGAEVEVVYPREPFEAPYHRGLGVKYPGDPADFPVFHVQTVTRRNDAIYPAAVVGKPPQEDRYMGDASQMIMGPLIKLIRPEVRDVWAGAQRPR